MEAKTASRGSPESAAWLRARLVELDLTQSSLARQMVSLGDDRDLDTILRALRRMASGEARVSGEMRVILALLGRTTSR